MQPHSFSEYYTVFPGSVDNDYSTSQSLYCIQYTAQVDAVQCDGNHINFPRIIHSIHPRQNQLPQISEYCCISMKRIGLHKGSV